MGDIIVLSILGAVVLLAVRSMLKAKKSGGCAGCSKCSGGCAGGCAGCSYNCSK